MNIDVLFFGATADLVGSRRVQRAVNETAVAADLIKQLREEYPSLSDRKLLFAVNEEYVGDDARLKSGDELAIFTPVSGG